MTAQIPSWKVDPQSVISEAKQTTDMIVATVCEARAKFIAEGFTVETAERLSEKLFEMMTGGRR